jgi:hypothetical protein
MNLLVIPYDAYQFWSRQAIKDVKKQSNYSHLNSEERALIGYLAFNNCKETNLENLLYMSQAYNSLPRDLPIKIQTDQENWMTNDKSASRIDYSYYSKIPRIKIISTSFLVVDDYYILD